MSFTPLRRGGSGPPLVCVHGFMDTWRTWELVLPALERHHDVLAVTLAGHAGGPPLPGELTPTALADGVERAMDDAGFALAHVAGNSLGGYVGLQLAARGRARSVVALAPAGGWVAGDPAPREVLALELEIQRACRAIAPNADALAASPGGRRQITRYLTTRFEHIPADLAAHLTRGVAACDGAAALVEYALAHGWELDGAAVRCPVRFVWGTEDELLPWPSAAARYRAWFPHADWVELDGVGHAPQLDVPLETAELIRGFSA